MQNVKQTTRCLTIGFGLVLAWAGNAGAHAPITVLSCGAAGHSPDAPPPIDPVAAERLFETLFFRHLRRPEDCPNKAHVEQRGENASGDIVPSIVSILRGSFTAPKIKETLYIVAVGECGVPEELGSHRIVITRPPEDKIVFIAPYAGSLATGVVNVDGDGIDEWVSISSSCLRGICTESATVMRASGLRLTTVKDLGAVSYSTCCAGEAQDTPGQLVCSSVVLREGKYLKVTETRTCSCL